MMKSYTSGWGETPESRTRQLIERRDKIEKRLNDGEEYFANAGENDRNRIRWEDEWIRLLHEYEATCDELASMPIPAKPTELRMAS